MKFFKNRKSRKQLLKEITNLKEDLEKCSIDYFAVKDLYQSHCKLIKTIKTTCITQDKGGGDRFLIAKECLCSELAKQLLPYVYFEDYVIADEYHHNDIKHVGTIKILVEKVEE